MPVFMPDSYLQYDVVVVGTMSDGTKSQPSNMLSFSTPAPGCGGVCVCVFAHGLFAGFNYLPAEIAERFGMPSLGKYNRWWCALSHLPGFGGVTLIYCCVCSAPSIVDANPSSPTSAEVTLNPPANAGPVDSYQVSLCPITGGDCITATCKTTVCEVPGLKPDTTYEVTADAIIAGKPVPTSNTVEVTMPPAGAPALTSADDTSSTTGYATAEPPAGLTFTQYTFTATPLSGGAPVVVTSSTPSVNFTGLTPATQVG
jgi:hypothetical protein